MSPSPSGWERIPLDSGGIVAKVAVITGIIGCVAQGHVGFYEMLGWASLFVLVVFLQQVFWKRIEPRWGSKKWLLEKHKKEAKLRKKAKRTRQSQ